MNPIVIKTGGRWPRLSGGAALSAWWALVCAGALAQVTPPIAQERPLAPVAMTGQAGTTLRQAVEAAWQRSPWARAQSARQDALDADARVTDAWVAAPPTASVGRLSDQPGRNAPRQEWEAELSVPLWWPGQRDAGRTLNQRSRAQLAAEAAAQKLAVAQAVREAWWAAVDAEEQVALWQGRVDSARALHEDVARRHRAGELARVDAQAASAEWLAARGELAGAQQVLRAARGRWQALTGIAPPLLRDAEVPQAVATAGELEADPVAGSLQQHPALVAARLAAEAAQARIDVAATAAREAPEVGVRVVRERKNATESFDNTVGVRVSVPLGTVPRTLRASAEARAEWLEADARQALVASRLQAEWAEAREAVQTAAQRWQLARERAEMTADSERLLHKAFSLGELDLATLLRARAIAFDADRDLRRQRRALDAAQDQLQQALGRLP
ncbi:TolC family protein [uncultured Aquabacterium sp.]|uniref:TolC family protein n=1 Tax=uncultured Aquabacterium sp. TaxID=158753 RepID=UPI0025D6D0E3|nr:TolC family protein [uncultured Aquabacterium sp.]